jgi:hypothetical protein
MQWGSYPTFRPCCTTTPKETKQAGRPDSQPCSALRPAGQPACWSLSLCLPACRTTLETCHLPLSATRPRPSYALTTTAAGSQRAHAARHSNGTDALAGLLTMYCSTPFHSDQHQSWVVQNRDNPWLVRRKNRARRSPCTGEKIIYYWRSLKPGSHAKFSTWAASPPCSPVDQT